MEKNYPLPPLPDLADLQNPAAYESVMRHFAPLIKTISHSYFLKGGDIEDLMQEGYIALYHATRSFDAAKNNDFEKYAKICIHRAMINAIKSDARQKNTVLSFAVEYTEDLPLADISAEEAVLGREKLLNVYERIEDALTPTERKILSMVIDGQTHKQIGAALGKTPKAIESTLARIRGKLE